MSNEELLKVMGKYGADIDGVLKRFMNDVSLYHNCLSLFLEDKSFEQLSAAMAAHDCQRAFDAAHNMKGIAANLGLTPLLDPVCRLVEPLRAGNIEGLEPIYDEIKEQMAIFAALL